ncbi:hypothetical protein BC937DRAFT_89105 [Endogone sp. FLAS-F59071]|nr:hypothetical protein BC937DRAFT_89105 [Endogone sp. FLAS-F59071]|eukprot:RUS23290.1 hypothetical protein BC937DRAFT_89105 [Endogone sp. FLAS-F59071]
MSSSVRRFLVLGDLEPLCVHFHGLVLCISTSKTVASVLSDCAISLSSSSILTILRATVLRADVFHSLAIGQSMDSKFTSLHSSSSSVSSDDSASHLSSSIAVSSRSIGGDCSKSSLSKWASSSSDTYASSLISLSRRASLYSPSCSSSEEASSVTTLVLLASGVSVTLISTTCTSLLVGIVEAATSSITSDTVVLSGTTTSIAISLT